MNSCLYKSFVLCLMLASPITLIGAILGGLLLTGCSEEAPSGGTRVDGGGKLVDTLTQVAVKDDGSGDETRAGEDWPAFLGPRGNGTSSEVGISLDVWKPHPPLVWTMQLGTSYGAPSISQGRLLQFDRFGTSERLTCFEAATAKELWRQENVVEYSDKYGYNNGPRCSPVVSDNLVFTYGVSGQLSCIELETGKLVWTKNLVEEYSVVQNFFGVASTPYVFDDLLLVMVGGSPAESLRMPLDLVEPNGTAIVAFDILTGEEKYRVGDDLASYASVAVQDVGGKPTGLAFLRSGLMAWEPNSGKRLFDFPWRASILESVNASLPVVLDDKILLSETYEIGSVLLDVSSGSPQVVWQDEGRTRNHAFRAHWSTPAVVDGYLYGCSGRNQPDSDFRCVRLSDGKVMWFDRRHERSSVLLVDGHLIVLGENGLLELIEPNPNKLNVLAEVDMSRIADPDDGKPLLDYPCWAAPVLSHGLLYLRGREHLICLNLLADAKS